MALIMCNNLSFSYNENLVISNLSLEINQGDYLCIIGKNGSGKSTLISGLLGLKKPSSGDIKLCADLKRSEIGYLPQQTVIQKDFPASVFEVVLSGCLNRNILPFYTKQNKSKALTFMEKLDIVNFKNKCYKELSGGQQQRVLLARALCATNKILVLDEPANGLDPIVSSDLYKIIKKINTDMKITIIMVSHDIKSALKDANMILHLNNTPLFFGKKADYLNSEIGMAFMGGVSNV